jgi:hypothetical protein
MAYRSLRVLLRQKLAPFVCRNPRGSRTSAREDSANSGEGFGIGVYTLKVRQHARVYTAPRHPLPPRERCRISETTDLAKRATS